MRYFLLIFGLVVIAVVLIAGRRGDLTRNRPIQIFPDMKRQLKLRPQTPNAFFANGLSSQLPQPGTIAQSGPMSIGGREIYPFEDDPVNTGRVTGATNFVELNPVPISGQLLARGQRQYNIYCAPCHGQTGDGNGMVKKFGMATVRSLHEAIVVKQPDGELFHTVSAGKSTMQGYAAQVPVEDRWAIIAYLRALQLSHLGTVEDLGPEVRARLK